MALFDTMAPNTPGLLSTPYAVAAVITSAKVIHTYTFLISTGKAEAEAEAYTLLSITFSISNLFIC